MAIVQDGRWSGLSGSPCEIGDPVIRPDQPKTPFIARWNGLIRILLVEPSVKLVARTMADHADFKTGANCHPGNELLARVTGYSERTVRDALAVLRGLGLADRTERGKPRVSADTYKLVIPSFSEWSSLPVLGPNEDKFTCLGCYESFEPVGHQTYKPKVGVVFDVYRFCFCGPLKTKTEACLAEWNRQQERQGRPRWAQLDSAARWELLRVSRADDWEPLPAMSSGT